jgi:hypothetical protein
MTASDEHRAGKLAALPQLGITLPATVRAAITGYEAVMALPVAAAPLRPGADRRAITALADDLARDALTGKRPAAPSHPLGVSAITRARQDEQDAYDRAALARELRSAAAVVLVQAFSGENGQQVIGAIQARHAEVVDGLCKRARRLPPGADDQSALQQGGQHRIDYLAACDAVAELARLREAIRLVDDRTPPQPVDGLSLTLAWEKTGALARTWLAPSGTTTHGDLDSIEFWLSAAREPAYQFWAPTADEQAARLAELRAERQAQRVQAAGVR